MRARRGFTLIELVVAMGVGALAVSLSVQAVMSVIATMRTQEIRQEADDDAKMLADFMVGSLQGVGGGSVRPWALLNITNSTTASDSLTFFVPDPTIPECGVTGTSGVNLDIATGPCCLTAAWDNRPFVYLSADGSGFLNLRATAVNTGPCNLQANPGQGANPTPNAANLAALAPGVVATGRVHKYFRDNATRTLRLWQDTNNDLVEDAGEITVLADRVFDLQFSLGYDVISPTDGVVTDASSTADEWLFNAAADAWNGGGLAGVAHNNLRMIWVAVTVGVPAAHGGRDKVAGNLDGPQIVAPGFHLRSVSGKAYMRNIFFFNL